MTPTKNIIKTLVIDFYPPHLREAIVRLGQNRIIEIKYWLIDGEGKYAGEENMRASVFDKMWEEYLNGPRLDIPDHDYDIVRQYLYSFMNIDNRWNPSTENCTYVHDFNALFQIWYHT